MIYKQFFFFFTNKIKEVSFTLLKTLKKKMAFIKNMRDLNVYLKIIKHIKFIKITYGYFEIKKK